jgi:hypothetical protein
MIKHTLTEVAASAAALRLEYTVTKVHGLSRYFVNSTHEEQHNIFAKLSIALQPANLVLIIPAFNRGVDLVTLKFVYPNTLGAAGPNEIATRAIIASAVPELIPTVNNSYAPISDIMKANSASSPPTCHTREVQRIPVHSIVQAFHPLLSALTQLTHTHLTL